MISERVVAADASRCSICYDSYEGRRTEPLRPCGHSEFCASCVDEWVRHQVEVVHVEPRCSYCRAPITRIGTRILNIRQALLHAAQQFNVEETRYLLSSLHCRTMDYFDWSRLITAVCNQTPADELATARQRDIIELLLANIRDPDLSCIRAVASRGRLDLLQLFLARILPHIIGWNGLYLTEARREALRDAAIGGHMNIIDFLLPGSDLSSKRVSLIEAAYHGSLAAVERFLSVLSPEELTESRYCDAWDWRFTQPLSVALEGTHHCVSAALSAAAIAGHRPTVEFLLQRPELSPLDRLQAVSDASRVGSLEGIRLLMERIPWREVSVEVRRDFFHRMVIDLGPDFVARGDRAGVIRYLLTQNFVPFIERRTLVTVMYLINHDIIGGGEYAEKMELLRVLVASQKLSTLSFLQAWVISRQEPYIANPRFYVPANKPPFDPAGQELLWNALSQRLRPTTTTIVGGVVIAASTYLAYLLAQQSQQGSD